MYPYLFLEASILSLLSVVHEPAFSEGFLSLLRPITEELKWRRVL